MVRPYRIILYSDNLIALRSYPTSHVLTHPTAQNNFFSLRCAKNQDGDLDNPFHDSEAEILVSPVVSVIGLRNEN